MNVAIVVAAGRSSRMKLGQSKQYLPLLGKPVLAHTLFAFEKCSIIDEVILVVNQDDMEFCRNEVVGKYNFRKVSKIVKGGKERQDSVYNGLCLVSPLAETVLIHDGARPFVTSKIIAEAVSFLKDFDGVVVGIPVKDTIKVVEDDIIKGTSSREKLWMAQTPQVFALSVLRKAYEKAKSDNFYGTDDSVLLERMGYKVKMVTGSCENIKITTQDDLALAGEILKKRGFIE